MIGWKLFEMTLDKEPKSLVHGVVMKYHGIYSRKFPLDIVLMAKADTPGFNFFLNKHEAITYLPRFRTRKNNLYLCEITASGVHRKSGSSYATANSIIIDSSDWDQRTKGEDLLNSRTISAGTLKELSRSLAKSMESARTSATAALLVRPAISSTILMTY
jgi:hypothetical protein